MLSLARSKWLRSLPVRRAARECRTKLNGSAAPPNKGMKLTKLESAPTLAPQAALRPFGAAGCPRWPISDAGTASQLIASVRRRRRRTGVPDRVGAPECVLRAEHQVVGTATRLWASCPSKRAASDSTHPLLGGTLSARTAVTYKAGAGSVGRSLWPGR